ncbi:MAG: septum site-determining protein MinC [Chloroflexi bacterium]|nr:septum site-determining protein MinC [Chloroflexota bacterium]
MSFVSFKGTREGLSITLGDGGWREMMSELTNQLGRPSAQSFFRGARVLLETGGRAVAVTQIEELIALLAQHDMTLVSVMGEAHAQANFNQLRATIPPPELLAEETRAAQARETEPLVIRRTIRSGQVVRHAGMVIVLGDVNPGAEVIANGDVIVWGKLRGVVHAGAAGDLRATVGALILMPTQLRIGDHIARAPDEKRVLRWPAEIARVRDGQIIVEPWGTS